MEEKNKIFDKGITLAKHAISQIEGGDVEGFQNSWNAACDEFKKALNSLDGDTSLYGENRNFGVIMHVIMENLSPKSLGTKDGRNAWRSVIETIKGDPVLFAENKVYDAITNPIEVKNPKEYVDSALSLLEGFNIRQMRASNEKLIKAIRESGLDEMVQIPDEFMTLYENIEDAITKRGVLAEVDGFVNSRSYLVEHVKTGGVIQTAIDESKLNDDERMLIEEVNNSTDGGASMFEECKKNALNAIKEASEGAEGESLVNGLMGVYERVENAEIDKNNPAASIAEMIEIKNTIEL